MKLCFISPPKFLGKFSSQGDIELCLAHLMGNEEYVSYFVERQKQGVHVILDNSLIELGGAVDATLLFDLLKKYGFPEVVAPDALGDGETTRELVGNFTSQIRKEKELRDVNVMGVVQGKNWEDFIKTYTYMYFSLDVDVIGIPFTIDFEVPGVIECPDETVSLTHARRRLAISQWISTYHDILRHDHLPVHLLGLHDGIELKFQKQFPFIRSNDSASAFISGYNDVRYDEELGLCSEKFRMDFTIEDIDDIMGQKIQHNIGVLKKYVQK